MVKELTPGAASRAAGQVKYPKAFSNTKQFPLF